MRIRDCPAAVSGNDRRHQALGHRAWEATASRARPGQARPRVRRPATAAHARRCAAISVTSREGRRHSGHALAVVLALPPPRVRQRDAREGEWTAKYRRGDQTTVHGYPAHRAEPGTEAGHRGLLGRPRRRRRAARDRRRAARAELGQLRRRRDRPDPVERLLLYDQVLDTARWSAPCPSATPRRPTDLDTYFAMARGTAATSRRMEMTKWFDTNYHYIVPELGPDTTLLAASGASRSTSTRRPRRSASHAAGAARAGHLPAAGQARRRGADGFDRSSLLDALLRVYAEVIERARRARRRLGAARRALPRRGPHRAGARRAAGTPTRRSGEADERPALLRRRPTSTTSATRSAGAARAAGRRRSASTSCAGREQRRRSPAMAGARRQDAGRRRRRRPQRLAQRPRRRLDQLRAVLGLAGRAGRRRPPARCCTCRYDLDAEPRPRRRAALAGWRSPSRRSTRSSRSAAALARRRATPIAAGSRTPPALADRPHASTRSDAGCALALSPADARRAERAPSRAAPRSAQRSACRCCRPPRSARSRRPPRSAGPARSSARARSTRPSTSGRMRAEIDARDRAPGGARPRRAGARRARAQRHGAVLRRAARRLRRHRERLGAVLRHAAACARRSSSATSRGPRR